MSYRPPEEELEGPIDKIIDGMDDFFRAANCRENNTVDKWSDDHLKELSKIVVKMIKLCRKLKKLNNETW
jgi:uncharacterized protein Yka (UPF0111/DUF47 family)